MAGFNLGDIFVTFKGKTEGLKQAAAEAKNTSNAVNQTIQNSANLGRTMVGVAAGVVSGFLSARTAVEVFKNAADFEQTRIGLENMLGSADKARAMLSEVSEFAAQTPFEFPELAGAVRQLVAFGFSGEDAVKTMKQLGDVSAAVGAPIDDLAYLMGTLRTQGRAFTVDIRQFAQRGIPIYEYLAKVLKTNEQAISQMIEEGKIGFPEVQKAFQMMTAEGGKFHGTMEKQSQSLSGQLSTLKDNLLAAGRAFIGINEQGDITAGSIMDRLKGAIGGMNTLLEDASKYAATFSNALGMVIDTISGGDPTVQQGQESLAGFAQWLLSTRDAVMEAYNAVANYLGPKISDLWNNISNNLIPVLMRLWNEVIVPLIPVVGTVLVGAFGLLIDTINFLLPILTALGNWMIDNQPIVIGLATAVGVLWATMRVRDAIDTFMKNFDMAKNAAVTAFQTMSGGQGLAGLNNSLTAFGGWGIFAAAAVGAFALIIDKFQETMQVMDATQRAIESNQKSIDAAIQRARQQYNEKKISLERLNQIIQNSNSPSSFQSAPPSQQNLLKGIPGFASGVQNFAGGLAYVHKGEVLANLPRGTDVIPADQVRRGIGGTTIVVSLDGAHIIDANSAGEIAEIIGDGIIRKLQLSTRI